MRNLCHFTITCLVLLFTMVKVHAQDKKTVKQLVNEGIGLHDVGKFEDAIEKYKEALKIEPDNLLVCYELAYSLYSSGKRLDAIPYAEKILKADKSKFEAYEMLGNIYDDEGQPDKAVEVYTKGIAENPNYARLRYNLGVVYIRQKDNAQAEKCAIDAIKLDNKHPGSQWLYAMANYNQNKRVKAVIAMTSFLLLEPETQRAAKVFTLLQTTLASGVSREGDKKINVTIANGQLDSDYSAEEMMVSLAAASSVTKNLPPVEALADQLTSIYKITGELAGKKPKDDFFRGFYTEYFYKLAQSDNMPAFSRYISLSAYKDENAQWFKDNADKLKALQAWVDNTQRNF